MADDKKRSKIFSIKLLKNLYLYKIALLYFIKKIWEYICTKTKQAEIAFLILLKKVGNQIVCFVNQRIIKLQIPKHNHYTLTPSRQVSSTSFGVLNEALEDFDVKNIAITGGYGAGKSSFIRTFEDNNPQWRFLDISLANFSNNKEEMVAENIDLLNIEKSILEQIFFRVKSTKLPRSYFKRINRTSSLWSMFWSIFTLITLCSCCILLGYDPITTILKKISWIDKCIQFSTLPFLLIVFLYFSSILSKIIFVLSNLKVEKIGYKNIELCSNDDASLLNKHLDEILYFFEETQFDIVVFQDLDRFDNLEIFTRLRELNNFLNNSETIKRKIVFLYAVKDEMLNAVQARVKFFDYIIPIIPYINSSNSLDKLASYVSDQKVKINENLLLDISLYISDMRVLNNIYNEFNIYCNELEVTTNALDVTKMFAMIIYKNFEPHDFLKLHKSDGFVHYFIENKRMVQIKTLKNQKNLSEETLRAYLSTDFDNLKKDSHFKDKINNEGLLKILLINGYIDENFQNYISRFHEGYISIGEERFLRNIKEKGDQEFWDLEITNSNAVLKKIHEHEFRYKQSLNISLISYMLINKNYEPQIRETIDLICDLDKDTSTAFVKSFLDKSGQSEDLLGYLFEKKYHYFNTPLMIQIFQLIYSNQQDEKINALIEKKSFLTIMEEHQTELSNFLKPIVKEYFNEYLQEQNIVVESEEIIKNILENWGLSDDLKNMLVSKLDKEISNVKDLSNTENIFLLFKQKKIQPSWENIYQYLSKNNINNFSSLEQYIQHNNNAKKIAQSSKENVDLLHAIPLLLKNYKIEYKHLAILTQDIDLTQDLFIALKSLGVHTLFLEVSKNNIVNRLSKVLYETSDVIPLLKSTLLDDSLKNEILRIDPNKINNPEIASLCLECIQPKLEDVEELYINIIGFLDDQKKIEFFSKCLSTDSKNIEKILQYLPQTYRDILNGQEISLPASEGNKKIATFFKKQKGIRVKIQKDTIDFNF